MGQLFQLLQLSDIFLFRTGCQIPWLWDSSQLLQLSDIFLIRTGCHNPLAVGQLFQLLQLFDIFLFRTGCQIPWLWDSCSSCCSCLIYFCLEPVVIIPWLWDSCSSCCSCLIYFCLEPVVRSLGCGTAVPAAAAVWPVYGGAAGGAVQDCTWAWGLHHLRQSVWDSEARRFTIWYSWCLPNMDLKYWNKLQLEHQWWEYDEAWPLVLSTTV